MKSSQRQEIADKISKKIARIQDRRVAERTGKEALNALLDLEVITPKLPALEEKKKIVLYLKEGLTGVERNWTKYPNEIHKIMVEHLEKEAESVLYMYLWRKSWGFGRNYCRTSYSTIMQDTVISSRNTARRALAALVDKHFMVKALDMQGQRDVTQEGALYRILTPSEISSGVTEEGVLLSDIPTEGVPTQGMPTEDIGEEHRYYGNKEGMSAQSMPSEGMLLQGTARRGHTAIPGEGMPTEDIPKTNADITLNDGKHARRGHTRTEHPLKDNKDSLKDTLSPRDIISSFYKGIGQSRISKTKRERTEKSLKELAKDGFSLEDIHFAVEWTLENSKEEPYDFSIIKHTIGQAMAAKKKTEAEEAKRIEAERIAAQERAEEEMREREAAKIEAYKESLSAEERAKLRERAEAEIRDSGQFKEEFITDYLIEVKENEFIRDQIGKKMSE